MEEQGNDEKKKKKEKIGQKTAAKQQRCQAQKLYFISNTTTTATTTSYIYRYVPSGYRLLLVVFGTFSTRIRSSLSEQKTSRRTTVWSCTKR